MAKPKYKKTWDWVEARKRRKDGNGYRGCEVCKEEILHGEIYCEVKKIYDYGEEKSARISKPNAWHSKCIVGTEFEDRFLENIVKKEYTDILIKQDNLQSELSMADLENTKEEIDWQRKAEKLEKELEKERRDKKTLKQQITTLKIGLTEESTNDGYVMADELVTNLVGIAAEKKLPTIYEITLKLLSKDEMPSEYKDLFTYNEGDRPVLFAISDKSGGYENIKSAISGDRTQYASHPFGDFGLGSLAALGVYSDKASYPYAIISNKTAVYNKVNRRGNDQWENLVDKIVCSPYKDFYEKFASTLSFDADTTHLVIMPLKRFLSLFQLQNRTNYGKGVVGVKMSKDNFKNVSQRLCEAIASHLTEEVSEQNSRQTAYVNGMKVFHNIKDDIRLDSEYQYNNKSYYIDKNITLTQFHVEKQWQSNTPFYRSTKDAGLSIIFHTKSAGPIRLGVSRQDGLAEALLDKKSINSSYSGHYWELHINLKNGERASDYVRMTSNKTGLVIDNEINEKLKNLIKEAIDKDEDFQASLDYANGNKKSQKKGQIGEFHAITQYLVARNLADKPIESKEDLEKLGVVLQPNIGGFGRFDFGISDLQKQAINRLVETKYYTGPIPEDEVIKFLILASHVIAGATIKTGSGKALECYQLGNSVILHFNDGKLAGYTNGAKKLVELYNHKSFTTDGREFKFLFS